MNNKILTSYARMGLKGFGRKLFENFSAAAGYRNLMFADNVVASVRDNVTNSVNNNNSLAAGSQHMPQTQQDLNMNQTQNKNNDSEKTNQTEPNLAPGAQQQNVKQLSNHPQYRPSFDNQPKHTPQFRPQGPPKPHGPGGSAQ